jgi:hypothetical protein
MKLLAVGDSFTYGEELSDLNNAWPYLLGNKLDYTVNNLAKPGCGNTRMIRHAVEQINNYDLIIIAWSHFARTELADEHGFYDLWPGCSVLPYKDSSPWRSEVINYYSKHYNDQYLYNQYLINIILIQQYLKLNNKKYIMLDAFGNNNYRKNDIVANQIDSTFYVGWPTTTMMEWTYGTSQGPGGHFLEDGHNVVADKIYEHIRHLGWIS